MSSLQFCLLLIACVVETETDFIQDAIIKSSSNNDNNSNVNNVNSTNNRNNNSYNSSNTSCNTSSNCYYVNNDNFNNNNSNNFNTGHNYSNTCNSTGNCHNTEIKNNKGNCNTNNNPNCSNNTHNNNFSSLNKRSLGFSQLFHTNPKPHKHQYHITLQMMLSNLSGFSCGAGIRVSNYDDTKHYTSTLPPFPTDYACNDDKFSVISAYLIAPKTKTCTKFYESRELIGKFLFKTLGVTPLLINNLCFAMNPIIIGQDKSGAFCLDHSFVRSCVRFTPGKGYEQMLVRGEEYIKFGRGTEDVTDFEIENVVEFFKILIAGVNSPANWKLMCNSIKLGRKVWYNKKFLGLTEGCICNGELFFPDKCKATRDPIFVRAHEICKVKI